MRVLKKTWLTFIHFCKIFSGVPVCRCTHHVILCVFVVGCPDIPLFLARVSSLKVPFCHLQICELGWVISCMSVILIFVYVVEDDLFCDCYDFTVDPPPQHNPTQV